MISFCGTMLEYNKKTFIETIKIPFLVFRLRTTLLSVSVYKHSKSSYNVIRSFLSSYKIFVVFKELMDVLWWPTIGTRMTTSVEIIRSLTHVVNNLTISAITSHPRSHRRNKRPQDPALFTIKEIRPDQSSTDPLTCLLSCSSIYICILCVLGL